MVSVFVERDHATVAGSTASLSPATAGISVTAERGRLATMEVPVAALPELAEDPSVVRIELGETLKQPRPKVSTGTVSAPSKTLRRFGADGGKNVLIGIIDVEGFDFAHPDFLDEDGGTRFVSIWDQGGDAPSRRRRRVLVTGREIDAAST